ACSTVADDCNGDGNGLISNNSSTDNNEAFRAWQHLHLSQFILGQYSGLGNNVLIGSNVPISELRGGSYMFDLIPTSNENSIRLGVANGQNNNSPALTVFEALSIDLKIDDGTPIAGNIRADNSTSSTLCVDSGNYTDVSNEDIICVINFIIPNN
ncbi:MAG: hypothetical protein MK137_02995, partial [Rickettsiales bacterium]|nr:hypothetical protein [Rickettsiales bacterium]